MARTISRTSSTLGTGTGPASTSATGRPRAIEERRRWRRRSGRGASERGSRGHDGGREQDLFPFLPFPKSIARTPGISAIKRCVASDYVNVSRSSQRRATVITSGMNARAVYCLVHQARRCCRPKLLPGNLAKVPLFPTSPLNEGVARGIRPWRRSLGAVSICPRYLPSVPTPRASGRRWGKRRLRMSAFIAWDHAHFWAMPYRMRPRAKDRRFKQWESSQRA